VSESGDCHVVGQSELPGHAIQNVARGIQSGGRKIVVPSNTAENVKYVGPAPSISYQIRSDARVGEERVSIVVRDHNEERDLLDKRRCWKASARPT
jgi:hypothetical protein